MVTGETENGHVSACKPHEYCIKRAGRDFAFAPDHDFSVKLPSGDGQLLAPPITLERRYSYASAGLSVIRNPDSHSPAVGFTLVPLCGWPRE